MRRLLAITIVLALLLTAFAGPAFAKADKPGKPDKPGTPTITLFEGEDPYADYVDFLGVCQFESRKVLADRPGTLTFWAYDGEVLLATGEVDRIGKDQGVMAYQFACDGPQHLVVRHVVELTNKKGELLATAEDEREFYFREFSGP